MRKSVEADPSRVAVRIAGLLAVSSAAFLGATSGAYAISPFSDFGCPGLSQTVSNLDIVPPSNATGIDIAAGQRLTITVTNGASGTIVRTDTNQVVIDLFVNQSVGTIDGPVTSLTLNTPNIGGGGGLFDNDNTAAGVMGITFSCSPIGGSPPPFVSNAATFLDSALADMDDRERFRMSDLFGNMFDVLGANGLDASPGDFGFGDVFAPGGWTLKGHFDGGQINRASGGITRQTTLWSLSLLGIRPFGDDKAFGAGVKVGGALSTQNIPSAVLDGTVFGVDLFLGGRTDMDFNGDGDEDILDRAIYYGGYIGYEAGTFAADVAGATGTFNTGTFKLGGDIEGSFDWNGFTITPSISALLQLRHRNGYTDSLGGAVPSSDTTSFDLAAGKTISRDFFFPERDMTLTPYVGGNLLFNVTSVTPALGAGALPPDAFRVEVFGGLQTVWGNGVTASLEADFTSGPTTSALGVSGSLHAPIETLESFFAFEPGRPPPPPP